MHRLNLLVLSLLMTISTTAQDSTAARAHAAYWCDCLAKIDGQLPEDSLISKIQACQSLSLTNLLNEKIITIDLLSDSAKYIRLNEQTIALMMRNCIVLSSLLSPAKEKEPAYREENPESLFVPSAFYKSYGMEQGETNTRFHVYNMINKNNKYQRSVDIRWVFESKEDALKWHRMNMQKNAEDGAPVKGNFTINGAEEIAVFRESAGAAEIMKAFGMVQRHHYFLFVVGNVVCKVFVATDETLDSKDLLPFAAAAAKQVKDNQPK